MLPEAAAGIVWMLPEPGIVENIAAQALSVETRSGSLSLDSCGLYALVNTHNVSATWASNSLSISKEFRSTSWWRRQIWTWPDASRLVNAISQVLASTNLPCAERTRRNWLIKSFLRLLVLKFMNKKRHFLSTAVWIWFLSSNEDDRQNCFDHEWLLFNLVEIDLLKKPISVNHASDVMWPGEGREEPWRD